MTTPGNDRKLLVEKIFLRKHGWQFSKKEVPVRRTKAQDGNPNIYVTVDGIEILIYQIVSWALDAESQVTPDRIVAMAPLPWLEVNDAILLLKDNFDSACLPAWCVDEDGVPNIASAFPVGPDFPVGLARRQLLVNIG